MNRTLIRTAGILSGIRRYTQQFTGTFSTPTLARAYSTRSKDNLPLGELTHINTTNNTPTMVNITEKKVTRRLAQARSVVRFPGNILEVLSKNGASVGEINTPKGPVFATAIVAGTLAVKRTSELIPFCHPILIEDCKFDVSIRGNNEVVVNCAVEVYHKTGVEMEALTGASVAALTIYDMCKALSHGIVISETKLVRKTGGKSDYVVEE